MNALILTQAQAEAIYNAMCAMNTVGGQIKATVQLCTVEEIGGALDYCHRSFDRQV